MSAVQAVQVQAGAEALLSRPNSKAGRLQRACLALIGEHERDGALPTSIRFLFYELEQRGVIPKKSDGVRQPAQDVSDALMRLRETSLVPWHWIVDETRSLIDWSYAPSVADYLADAVDHARIDCWAGNPPPLILCESRSLAGVLRELAAAYLCPISATNGQSGGFVVTDVVPRLRDNDRQVLYLGDWDWCGSQIETATRRTCAEHTGRTFTERTWQRVALTAEQVREHQLPVITKKDLRYNDGRPHEAVETEALRQAVIVDLVRRRLDELLPEPLDAVRVRERAQRDAARDELTGRPA